MHLSFASNRAGLGVVLRSKSGPTHPRVSLPSIRRIDAKAKRFAPAVSALPAKDLGIASTRRLFVPDHLEQEGGHIARFGIQAASATADVGFLMESDRSVEAKAAVVSWVEAECLSLEASLEDLVQSLGNDMYGPDLGSHMQHHSF